MAPPVLYLIVCGKHIDFTRRIRFQNIWLESKDD